MSHMRVNLHRLRVEHRYGAASVELALVLTFVLVPILLGIWEVGRMVEVQQNLYNAVREGGRQASTGQKTIAQVQQTVVNYLSQCGITIAPTDVTLVNLTNASRYDPTVGSQSQNAQPLDHFQISVSVPFDNVRWIVLSKITTITTLTATADWYSMNNQPLTVSTTIPGMPQ
jgi:Flp pilus assembly protein TadG